MKKIAYIVSDISTGGIPRALETLTTGLASKGYNQTVIALQNKKSRYDIKGELVYLENVGNNIISKMYILLKRWYKLYKIISRGNYDAVVSFSETANFLNILIKKNGRTVISERNVPSKELDYRKFNKIREKIRALFFRILLKKLYGKADAIIPVSRYVAYDLSHNFNITNTSICPIYNGVNIEKITIMANEKLSREEEEIFNPFTLISVGAVSSQKGHWHLLRIMPLLIEKYPKANLVILGDGDYLDRLRSMVGELNLKNKVYLLGRKNNPYKYMKKSSIFVFPSIYEGCPNALMEAMAMGMAIVSADCLSGPRELLAPNSSITDTAKKMEMVDSGILSPPFFDEWTCADVPILPAEFEMLQGIISYWDNDLVEKFRGLSKKNSKEYSALHMITEYEKIIIGKC